MLCFIQIQPIKAACIQAGTCLHLVDREENSVSKFFDFESCVILRAVLYNRCARAQPASRFMKHDINSVRVLVCKCVSCLASHSCGCLFAGPIERPQRNFILLRIRSVRQRCRAGQLASGVCAHRQRTRGTQQPCVVTPRVQSRGYCLALNIGSNFLESKLLLKCK
jgi:hypothetical protein